MNSRKASDRISAVSIGSRRKRGSGLRYGVGSIVLFLLTCAAVALFSVHWVYAPEPTDSEEQAIVAEAKSELIDFQMVDFSKGWAQYTDRLMKTEDGGVSWVETAAESANLFQDEEIDIEAMSWIQNMIPAPDSITIHSIAYPVKKTQFFSKRMGWALLANAGTLKTPLWVTIDGGETWNETVTADVQEAMETELGRLQKMVGEAGYYREKQAAEGVFQSEWTLMPNYASPGDVVLVRHRDPGSVEWQGKSYMLAPFGTGYFTYLPISMDMKTGNYPIGNQVLTIRSKKFDTQYLQVTEQLESMRQDTNRILADQKKIDLARSKSQSEFLFTSSFIKPVEGILTTPFGYTRYVNGKYDSSHRAIDLAAKTGTPIQAANDGIVVLADNLYLTGNSIYIDHGMNLFSQYAHLSKLNVAAGDHVKQGDIIGLVGSTGFSTGPHLHFTFWAHNVPVNPNLFFDTTPFHWLGAE